MSEELPELPKGWVWTTMAEVTRVVGGSTPSSKVPVYWDGDIPWLAVSDLTGHAEKQIGRGNRNITRAGYEACSTQLVPAGTVLFSSRAPIGYAAIATNPLCTSQGFKSFIPEEGLDSSYLYWYLRSASAKSFIESRASGTTFKELSGKAAETVPVPLPPVAEQWRIVDRIEKLCADIDIGRQELAKAASDLGQLEHALRIRATEGHPLTNLGSLVSHIRYGTSVRCTADADGPPVLRIPNVRGGEIDTTDLKFATKPASELGDCITEEGDLLFVRTNGSRELIGRVAVVNEDAQFAFASYLIRARPSERLDPQWAAMALSTPALRADLEARAASTAGQYNLNIQSLRSLEIPLPPLDEQRRLVRVARDEIAAAATVLSETRKADATALALVAAVLEKGFRGELSTQSSEDRPATEILKAIAQSRASLATKRTKARKPREERAAATS